MSAALFVVATPIGNLEDISPRALRVLGDVDVILAEDTRHTGHLLHHFGINTSMQSLHAHNEKERLGLIKRLWNEHQKVALVTDAGTPAISDPGALVVDEAHRMGVPVFAVAGPSALTAALSVSGFAMHHGAWFMGFLPRKGKERSDAMHRIQTTDGVVVMYESPERVRDTLCDLAEKMPNRMACVSREITKRFEEHVRQSLHAWSTATHEPRGEYVIVLDALERINAEAGDDAIMAALSRCMDAGMSARDAAHAVALVLDAPKRRCYALAIGFDTPSLKVYKSGAGGRFDPAKDI